MATSSPQIRTCVHTQEHTDTGTEKEGLLSHPMGPRSCYGECPHLDLSS